MRMKNKKGVSTIVTVVLLILVSITAVALIAAFVVPFIRGSLTESQECFAVLGKLEVTPGQYTCQYKTTTNASLQYKTLIQIKRGFAKDIEIKSLAVVLSGEGKSKKFDLVTGDRKLYIGEYVNNADDGFNTTINLPEEGEEKTYVFNLSNVNFRTLIDTVQVSSVLKSGKVCEAIIAQISDCEA